MYYGTLSMALTCSEAHEPYCCNSYMASTLHHCSDLLNDDVWQTHDVSNLLLRTNLWDGYFIRVLQKGTPSVEKWNNMFTVPTQLERGGPGTPQGLHNWEPRASQLYTLLTHRPRRLSAFWCRHFFPFLSWIWLMFLVYGSPLQLNMEKMKDSIIISLLFLPEPEISPHFNASDCPPCNGQGVNDPLG